MALLVAAPVNAQCDFVPVISPDDLILCPDATDTLMTTELFDAYQWYQNNKLIPGATDPYYVVNSYNDAATFFKVTVTRNGCTATSKKVLVDGYAFASPIIISSGDVGVYDPNRGVTVECPGNTLILTYGKPYTQNVQWYNNSNPINGATEQSYSVTRKGSYTVCGSPALCPSFTQCELIPIDVIFQKPEAVITQGNDTLFASKAKHYQWYFNEIKIPGAKNNFIIVNQKGSYTVMTADKYTCTALSLPFVISTDKVSMNDIISIAPNPVKDVLHIQLKTAGVYRVLISDFYGNRFADIQMFNASETLLLPKLHSGNYLLQLINKEQKVIATKKIFKE